MRIYYDEDGKMVGCNNVGHEPDGAVGFTTQLPASNDMRWDFIGGGWCKPDPADEVPQPADMPSMQDGEPTFMGEQQAQASGADGLGESSDEVKK